MSQKIILNLLQKVQSGELDLDDAEKAIAAAKQPEDVTYKVSQKGAISFYRIRRMPITLYVQELEKIVEVFNTNEFQIFLSENESTLSRK